MRLGRITTLIAGSAALCITVGACGSRASSAAPPKAGGSAAIMLTAYRATIASKSAQVSIQEGVTADGQNVIVDGTGAIDMNGKEATFTFAEPNVGTEIVREIEPVIYLQLPAKDRKEVPAGKSWISLNLDTLLEAKFGASLSQLSSSSQAPMQTLAYLQSVSDGVRTIGARTVAGVATTEYGATVDLTKAGATKNAAAKAAIKKIEAAIHASAFPMEVWLDSSHRVRQISYQITAHVSGQSEGVAFTMTFKSFGGPVHVTAPPASQTFDATGAAVKAGSSQA